MSPSKGSSTVRQVLVVDSDPLWQELLGALVESVGVRVKVNKVDTVARAVAFLRKHPRCHLILSDYYLQGKPAGFELLAEAARLAPEVPFFIVAGISAAEISRLSEVRQLQAPGFISKLMPFEVIREALGRALGAERSRKGAQ